MPIIDYLYKLYVELRMNDNKIKSVSRILALAYQGLVISYGEVDLAIHLTF